jgi:predicted SprT family Zn-dependent metalloprotease
MKFQLSLRASLLFSRKIDMNLKQMAGLFAQLEFQFPKWMRAVKSSRAKSFLTESRDQSDPGMTVWCREQAMAFGLPELARKVNVVWNPRMQTTAGRAWWPSRLIEINPKLKSLSESQVWRTLKHEFAHLLAYERAGRRHIDAHGIEWQMACAELGIPGESARHSLPLKGRRIKRKYVYVCPCCLTDLKRVRPLRRAVACYSCCKKYNGGEYHDRFRMIKNKIEN